MPLYEFTCDRCRRPFTALVGMTAAPDSGLCPHCGSEKATRRISRFTQGRAETSFDDALAQGADPGDPQPMRQWAKEVENELGEGLGDEFEEYLEE
jgi:putative FmdB family regulatory protein